MALETTRWDAVDQLKTREDQVAYLEAAFELAQETGDHTIIAAAAGDVARARGMSRIAKDSGVTREGLYKGLSADGDPRLSTLLGVFKALDVKLSVTCV